MSRKARRDPAASATVPEVARREWEGLVWSFEQLHHLRVPCQAYPPEDWFDNRSHPQRRAVARCGHCPLQQACRRYARAAAEPEGVWGGETAAQRADYLKNTNRKGTK